MNASILGTLAFGFVLGMRHSLDADHLVAVSTIVSRGRSLWASSIAGAFWGMGHATSLFVAALAVILLRLTISPAAALSIEFAVGLMLVLLGLDVLRRLARGELRVHSHSHRHGGSEHAHLHVHEEPLTSAVASHHHVGGRSFFVGIVHGLAGSAALMLFVLTTIASPWVAVLYVLVFGLGTILGMLAMSSLIGLPIALASRFVPQAVGAIQLTAGLGSIGFGLVYSWRIGWVEGLFR